MKKIIFLLFIAFACVAGAQERFGLYAIGGLNVCQVDGDDAGHYNHPGLHAGIGSMINMDDDWCFMVELAYTQKGSHIGQTNGTIALQYVEMPLMLAYKTLDGHLLVAAGVAPAVNVGTSVTFGGIVDASQEALYRRFDWLPVTVELRYTFAEHLGIYGRWQNSMISIYNGSGPYRVFTSNYGAFNRLLSFGLSYQF